MISRSEASGLTLALLGHVVLFGLLSVGFLTTPNPLSLKPEAVEVSLVGEVGLESQAPVPSTEPMAAKLSPVEAPVEPEPAPAEPVVQPDPQPVAKPEPAPPRPSPDARAERPRPTRPTTTAAATPRTQPRRDVRPTGNLEGLDIGKSNTKSNSTSTLPPASSIGVDVKRSLAAEILRQIKPFWKPPSGADSDKLRTTIEVQLGQDGSIVGQPRVTQTGITESNRAQAQLHKERAERAVRLAAPFTLPPKFYNAWKSIAPTLYEDL